MQADDLLVSVTVAMVLFQVGTLLYLAIVVRQFLRELSDLNASVGRQFSRIAGHIQQTKCSVLKTVEEIEAIVRFVKPHL